MRRTSPGTCPVSMALVVVAAFTAGCVQDQPQAPILGNPKLLLDRTTDNLTRVYVHSAFGERAYDRLTVRIDNETVAAANDTYALVHKTDRVSFHLGIEARSTLANYTTTVLVRMVDDGAEVAIGEDEEFDDFREVALPWHKVVEAEPKAEPEADA